MGSPVKLVLKLTCCVALLVCTFIPASICLNIIYDETLWTKALWSEWKIPSTITDFNPSDDMLAGDLPIDLKNTIFNSIDGPLPRRENPPAASHHQQLADGGVEAIDDTNFLEPASHAAQCSVCHSLVTLSWTELVADIVSGRDVSYANARPLVWGMCENKVVDGVLSRYTIFKMESEGPTPMLFFVLRERTRGVRATLAERQAVRLSCKNLLRDMGDDLLATIMEQLEIFRVSLAATHAAADPDSESASDSLDSTGSGTATRGSEKTPMLVRGYRIASEGSDEEDEYEDDDDDDEDDSADDAGALNGLDSGSSEDVDSSSTSAAPGCVDLHPTCSRWANSGECDLNPAYMIGSRASPGHCRRACGVCKPRPARVVLPPGVEALSGVALQGLRNVGCGASSACLSGVSGTAFNGALLLSSRGSGGGQGSGFVLGKQFYGKPQTANVPKDYRGPETKASSGGSSIGSPLDSSSSGSSSSSSGTTPQQHGSAGGDGALPDGQADVASASSEGDAAEGSAASLARQVEQVLSAELGRKLLRIPAEFFTYEFLYRNHTRHFHVEKDGRLTEDWLLGKFQRESAKVEAGRGSGSDVAVLEELDLLPHLKDMMATSDWPYVKQVYAGGAQCTLAGNRKVIRRTEARIACSPGKDLEMLVREPDFCQYIYVIYSPALCTIPHYQPRPRGETV